MRQSTEPHHPTQPYAQVERHDSGGLKTESFWHHPGLTKREYFAALAMQGLTVGPGPDAERAGVLAVQFADALIAALNERSGS